MVQLAARLRRTSLVKLITLKGNDSGEAYEERGTP